MAELLIRVRFLDARFHGRGDDGAPEWPPSPLRLFQALVAAAKPCWSDPLAEAFEWLERQAAPVIHTPPTRTGAARLTYVPNNNSDTVRDPAQLRTGKSIQPTLILPADGARAEVVYRWSLPPGHEVLAQRLVEPSRRLRALGWGIDLAVGRAEVVADGGGTALPPVRYTPTIGRTVGGDRLRIPNPGSLASMEAAHAASLTRITPGNTLADDPGGLVFERAVYDHGARQAARPFAAFTLEPVIADGDRAPAEGADPEDRPRLRPPLRPGQIKAFVAMVRHAAATHGPTRDAVGAGLLDAALLGHAEQPGDTPGPRLSVLPLPSIGHPHSDGRIRRVILAEPFGGLDGLASHLGRLWHGLTLTPEDDPDRPVLRLARIDGDDPVVRTYTRTAEAWASATPVLLPGYDKRRDHRGDHTKRLDRAEALVRKALGHAGVEQPCRITLSRVPLIPGTDHAHRYHPRAKLAHYPPYHVRLDFDERFAGPLSLGAGRHAGFGVMAACG